jgi:hypothetical protein
VRVFFDRFEPRWFILVALCLDHLLLIRLVVSRQNDRLGFGLVIVMVAILDDWHVFFGRGRSGLGCRLDGVFLVVARASRWIEGCVQVAITGHHAYMGQDTGVPAS